MVKTEINIKLYFLMKVPKTVMWFCFLEREINLKNLISLILRSY